MGEIPWGTEANSPGGKTHFTREYKKMFKTLSNKQKAK